MCQEWQQRYNAESAPTTVDIGRLSRSYHYYYYYYSRDMVIRNFQDGGRPNLGFGSLRGVKIWKFATKISVITTY